MPFVKGQSGNPKGRPKDTTAKQIALQYAGEAFEKLVEWMRSADAKASLTACQVILDRAYGKAAQSIELSGSVQVSGIDKPPDETREQWIERKKKEQAEQRAVH